MPVSTPLDKIESHDDHPSDEDRVKRIIQEMNNTEAPGEPEQHPQQQQQQMPQPMYQQQQMPQYQQAPQYQPHPSQQPMYQQQEQPHYQQEQEPVKEEPVVIKKNIWAHITDVLKLPFVVSIVFFLLSLPIVDVYIAKYASWAFSSGGTLTMPGIAIKALTAGAVMGVYDTLDKVVSKLF
jgi:hypothetical protein